MSVYFKYIIKDSDHFIASEFLQLQKSLQKIITELPVGSTAHSTEMILSFVKDHSINSQQAKDYPELANMISSKSLPLQEMEALFEASRQNPLFRIQLEDYIRRYLDDFRPDP